MTFFSEQRQSSRGDRHGWNNLDSYLAIHDAQLQRLGSFFVEQDDLQVYLQDESHLVIEGRIWCYHGVYVDVKKILLINDRNQVQTIKYKYHAGLDGDSPRPIFRYDNSHTYVREHHPDPHHKHIFDHHTWEERYPPQWVGYANWPTLTEVIEELYDWWNMVGVHLRP